MSRSTRKQWLLKNRTTPSKHAAGRHPKQVKVDRKDRLWLSAHVRSTYAAATKLIEKEMSDG